MKLEDYLELHLSPTTFYRKEIPEWDGVHGTNVLCPFHLETIPSFSVNIKNTGGCYCHSCEIRIGSYLHYYKELNKLTSNSQAAYGIYSSYVAKILAESSETHMFPYEEELHSNVKALAIAEEELGFSIATLKNLNIGYASLSGRFMFPIIDEWGHLLNIRYYLPPSARKRKEDIKIYGQKGFNGSSLYPLNLLNRLLNSSQKPEFLVWHKAERDVILSWSLGIPAFCSTNGEATWDEKWIGKIKQWGVPIIICGDNDTVGIKSANRKLDRLQFANIQTSKITIPEEQKDFSDWIVKETKRAKDFLELPRVTFNNELDETLAATSIEVQLEPMPGILDPTKRVTEGEFEIADIGRKENILNTRIEVRGVVSGKLDRTYNIPYIFFCNGMHYVMPISRELLQFIQISDDEIIKIVKGFIGTKIKNIDIYARMTVTEVEVIPVVVPGIDSFFVSQRAYYFGTKIESNMPYLMHVIPTTSIKSQETLGLIVQVNAISSVLDHVTLTDEDIVALKNKFNPKLNQPCLKKFKEICDEIAERHTLISNRQDMHIAQLLTWLCPCQFNFFKEGIQRGWLNTLCLGDTQTGKSEIAKKLRELLACGSFISAENCTFVGLIGGVMKTISGVFMLRWGKIPLYNRQLVVIEELSGFSCEEISNMSDVRSSGIARIDKGGISGETSAKTRLLFLSNVRKRSSNISDYPSGVKAVQELIGQSEDISRFDLVVSLTDSEVSNDIINRDRLVEDTKSFSLEEVNLYRKLATYTWALKPNEITITEGAYKACLSATLDLCKIYHSSIPLFKGGSGRLKIMRIALSFACALFSFNEATRKIEVHPEHVEAAVKFLRECYDKPSLGYGKYSHRMFQLEKLIGEERIEKLLEAHLKDNERIQNFYRSLNEHQIFNREILIQSTDCTSLWADRLISTMFACNVVKKSTGDKLINSWEVTTPGRRWIETQLQELT